MAAEQTSKPSEAYPMKGGDSDDSYSNNSSYQVVSPLHEHFLSLDLADSLLSISVLSISQRTQISIYISVLETMRLYIDRAYVLI
jgi:hypothetical protein